MTGDFLFVFLAHPLAGTFALCCLDLNANGFRRLFIWGEYVNAWCVSEGQGNDVAASGKLGPHKVLTRDSHLNTRSLRRL